MWARWSFTWTVQTSFRSGVWETDSVALTPVNSPWGLQLTCSIHVAADDLGGRDWWCQGWLRRSNDNRRRGRRRWRRRWRSWYYYRSCRVRSLAVLSVVGRRTASGCRLRWGVMVHVVRVHHHTCTSTVFITWSGRRGVAFPSHFRTSLNPLTAVRTGQHTSCERTPALTAETTLPHTRGGGKGKAKNRKRKK